MRDSRADRMQQRLICVENIVYSLHISIQYSLREKIRDRGIANRRPKDPDEGPWDSGQGIKRSR